MLSGLLAVFLAKAGIATAQKRVKIIKISVRIVGVEIIIRGNKLNVNGR